MQVKGSAYPMKLRFYCCNKQYGFVYNFFHVLCLLIHSVYLSLSSFPALFTPEGVTRYQNQPQSVMNVVMSLSHLFFNFKTGGTLVA